MLVHNIGCGSQDERRGRGVGGVGRKRRSRSGGRDLSVGKNITIIIVFHLIRSASFKTLFDDAGRD